MKNLILLKMLFLAFFINAQNVQIAQNNWVYSNTVGLNFSGATPTEFNVTNAAADFNLATYLEGCASVSDQNGNLLMFSNGLKVWCRNNSNQFVSVPGSLQGDPSSVQNVIFIPKPGFPHRYFIVTISGNNNYLYDGTGYGLFYQEIDTSTQTMVNSSIPLSFYDHVLDRSVTVNQQFGNTSEAITSTKHSNGVDFWLLAHVQNRDGGRLLSFKVSCIGIKDSKLLNIGNLLTIENGRATAIKVSPNSQTFALFAEDSVSYGVFNNANGNFDPPNIISNVVSYNGEFSPNSNILFYNNSSQLIARNLSSQSDILVASTNTNGSYGIQIARDNRIYFTGPVKGGDTNRIRVINNPNAFNAFSVTSTLFNHPFIGFPQTVHSGIVANNDIYNFNFCTAAPTNSQSTSLGAVFQNDTNNGALISSSTGYTINTVGLISPSPSSGGITLNSNGTVTVLAGTPAGTYTLQYNLCIPLVACSCSNLATITIIVTKTTAVTPTFNQVGPICAGTVFSLPTSSTNNPPITGTWSPAINNMATTTYTFTPTAGLCATTATMTVTVNPRRVPTFNQVGPICVGTAFTLPTSSTNNPPITGTWSPAINNMATTTYTFTPNAGQCANPTTLTVVVNPYVTPTFNQIGPFCAGTAFTLPTSSTNNPPITGSWSPAINNTATTTYTFTPNLGQCTTAKKVQMTVVITPNVTPTFNQVAPVCAGTSFTLPTSSTNNPPITGTWSPAINNTATTTYIFTPNSGQCATPTTMTVTVLSSYNFSILDTYIDGVSSGNNSIGFTVNGNFPPSTLYEWFVTREDGSIDYYAPATNWVRTVQATYQNRVVYVEVIAHYNGCTKLATSSFRCNIPEHDIDGNFFPDCDPSPRTNEDSSKNLQVVVYPNPVISELHFEGIDLKNYSISIYDSMGKVVLKNERIIEKIDVKDLNSGFYFYEININEVVFKRGKFIKK